MKIVTFKDKYTIIDDNYIEVTSFTNRQDAINYINQQEGIEPENIIEYPFYEVDEHGQPIGN